MSNPLGEITRSPSIKDGLDDGPELPPQAVRDRAAAKIMAAQPHTDAERINWLETKKYFQVGIGYDGFRYACEVRLHDNGLKRYFGRSLRAAIDTAIDKDKNVL